MGYGNTGNLSMDKMTSLLQPMSQGNMNMADYSRSKGAPNSIPIRVPNLSKKKSVNYGTSIISTNNANTGSRQPQVPAMLPMMEKRTSKRVMKQEEQRARMLL